MTDSRPPPGRSFQGQFKRGVAFAAIALWIVLAAVRGIDLWQRHDEALEAGQERAANLALILTEYLRQAFEAIDSTTRQAAVHSRRVGGPAASAAEWGPTLDSLIAGLRSVGSLSVVDAGGIIRHSTIPEIVGQSRREEYVFQRLATTPTTDMHASTPFRARSGILLVPLARRLDGGGGTFEGIVAATFDPDQLRGFFKAVDVGRGGIIWVFHPERLILLREPSATNPIGFSAAGNALFEAALAPRDMGRLRAAVEDGGRPMLSAFSRLAAPPLIVAVSLDEAEILTDWRQALVTSAVLLAIMAAAMAAILFQLFRQIDARATAEQALARAQRLETIGRFTGGIAHDLNNILTIILGYADALRGPDDATARAAGQIEAAASRAADLIRRMLAFARLQPLQPRIVDLNQLLTGSLLPLLPRLVGEDVAVKTHLAPRPCLANIDPVQMESALMNLCVNARDAMPEGGLLIIETGLTALDEHYARANVDVAPGRYAMVSVSDNGAGISPENLPRVFEPFFTTKESGKGTGLGLSMVYGFVKQSGGHAKVYSELGHGTTVKVYLPEAATPAGTTVDKPSMVRRGTGQTVLVVEDEAAVRDLAASMLTKLGYRVLTAADGPAALAAARDHPEIDLLFTDVVLPKGMNGRQLAEEIQRLRPSLRVLYTSGYSENVVIHRGQLDPGIRLLSKPYDKESLGSSVADALDRVARPSS